MALELLCYEWIYSMQFLVAHIMLLFPEFMNNNPAVAVIECVSISNVISARCRCNQSTEIVNDRHLRSGSLSIDSLNSQD